MQTKSKIVTGKGAISSFFAKPSTKPQPVKIETVTPKKPPVLSPAKIETIDKSEVKIERGL